MHSCGVSFQKALHLRLDHKLDQMTSVRKVHVVDSAFETARGSVANLFNSETKSKDALGGLLSSVGNGLPRRPPCAVSGVVRAQAGSPRCRQYAPLLSGEENEDTSAS